LHTYFFRSYHGEVAHPSYFLFRSSDSENESVLLQSALDAGAVAATTANLIDTLQVGPVFVTVFLFHADYLPHIASSTEINFSWVILGLDSLHTLAAT
jgi:hypothetical protein